MIFKYKDLARYPVLDIIAQYEAKELKDILAPQYFEHMRAHLSNKTTLVRNAKGLIEAKKTYEGMDDLSKHFIGLMHKVPRSKLAKLAATKNPDFSAAVPYVMSAFKLYDDIGYEEWDKSDPFLVFFLSGMGWLLATDFEVPEESIEQLRIDHMTVQTTGHTEVPTKYKFNNGKVFTHSMLGRMYCQTWVFHSSIRTDLMILDPVNWDNVPEAEDMNADDVLNLKKGSTFELEY